MFYTFGRHAETEVIFTAFHYIRVFGFSFVQPRILHNSTACPGLAVHRFFSIFFYYYFCSKGWLSQVKTRVNPGGWSISY